MKAVAATAAVTGAAEAAALKKLARQAGEAAGLLKLLGNEKRLLILCYLAARGEMTVGELVEVVKLSQSALSQHLGRLRGGIPANLADPALPGPRPARPAGAAAAQGDLLRRSEMTRS